MEQNSIIESDSQDNKFLEEINFAKLKSIGKDYFQEINQIPVKPLDMFKDYALFVSLKFPAGFNEFFIPLEFGHYYWFCDLQIIKQSEESLRLDPQSSRGSQNDNYRTVKEFYNKWINVKTPEDKRSYAATIISLTEKNTVKQNFLSLIFLANVYLYESSFDLLSKATPVFEQAGEIALKSKLDEKNKNELMFLIKLYSAFAHIKCKEYNEAGLKLLESQKYKSQSINFKYYNAIIEKHSEEMSSTATLLNELLEFDLNRIRTAIKNLNFSQQMLSIRKAIIHNVLNEQEFAEYCTDIDSFLQPLKHENSITFDMIDLVLERLERLDYKQHYNDEIIKTIAFLKKNIEELNGNKSGFVNYFMPLFYEKVRHIVDMIISVLKNKYSSEINDRLVIFDNQMKNNFEIVKQIQKEMEDYKKAIESKMEKSIADYSDQVDRDILEIESKSNDIESIEKFNPQTAFKNSMIYNGIISLFVLIVGGFSSMYSSSDAGNSFRDMSIELIVSGVKWGMLAFIIGLVVSFIMAAFATMEKNNERQRLLKRIAFLRNQKEIGIDNLKQDFDGRLEKYESSANEKILITQGTIEFTKREKETEFQKLSEISDKKLQEHIATLNRIFDETTYI